MALPCNLGKVTFSTAQYGLGFRSDGAAFANGFFSQWHMARNVTSAPISKRSSTLCWIFTNAISLNNPEGCYGNKTRTQFLSLRFFFLFLTLEYKGEGRWLCLPAAGNDGVEALGWGSGRDQTWPSSSVCQCCPTGRKEQSKMLRWSLCTGRVTLVLELEATFLPLSMPEWVNEKLLIAGCRKIPLSRPSVPHCPTAAGHGDHMGQQRSSFHLYGENQNFCRHDGISQSIHQEPLRLKLLWTAFPPLDDLIAWWTAPSSVHRIALAASRSVLIICIPVPVLLPPEAD